MTIATDHPLLPVEVSIIILRKKNSTPGISKAYLVQGDKVEHALKGLCFGYPTGGMPNATPDCQLQYNGKYHIHMSVKGKFPNEYYADVNTKQDRINNLPDNAEELLGLSVLPVGNEIYDDPENDENVKGDEDLVKETKII